jgi:hypothetical protein
MARILTRRVGLLCLALTILAAGVHAQALKAVTANNRASPTTTSSVCGHTAPSPQTLPPSASGPVVYLIGLCFEPQGSRSRFPPESYLQDIQLKPSQPSQGVWTPYDTAVEKVIFEDYQRLWNNHGLADLSIDIRDFAFSNGVIGKLVSYNITERN